MTADEKKKEKEQAASELGLTVADRVLEVRGASIAATWLVPASVRQPTPIVFLHEGLGSVRQWKEFPARLCAATGSRGFVFDRLGHGRSGPLAALRSADYLREEAEIWLPAVLAAAGVARPILFGHSDGGSIALYFAAAHPVTALVVEAAHVFVEEITLRGIRELGEQWHTTDMAERSARSHGPKTEDLFRNWYGTWLSTAFRSFNMLGVLRHVVSPCLVLQGQADPYGTVAQVEAIVSGVSGPVRSWMVPGCGHAPHLESMDSVIDATAEFLSDVLA
jgi:pimeloyl-ACP methyl ester carboxylesterase